MSFPDEISRQLAEHSTEQVEVIWSVSAPPSQVQTSRVFVPETQSQSHSHSRSARVDKYVWTNESKTLILEIIKKLSESRSYSNTGYGVWERAKDVFNDLCIMDGKPHLRSSPRQTVLRWAKERKEGENGSLYGGWLALYDGLIPIFDRWERAKAEKRKASLELRNSRESSRNAGDILNQTIARGVEERNQGESLTSTSPLSQRCHLRKRTRHDEEEETEDVNGLSDGLSDASLSSSMSPEPYSHPKAHPSKKRKADEKLHLQQHLTGSIASLCNSMRTIADVLAHTGADTVINVEVNEMISEVINLLVELKRELKDDKESLNKMIFKVIILLSELKRELKQELKDEKD